MKDEYDKDDGKEEVAALDPQKLFPEVIRRHRGINSGAKADRATIGVWLSFLCNYAGVMQFSNSARLLC